MEISMVNCSSSPGAYKILIKLATLFYKVKARNEGLEDMSSTGRSRLPATTACVHTILYRQAFLHISS
jgi:hypothetical protein